MKIVILAPEAHGHVNPTLPLAAALTARGHEVVYFLPEAFAPVAEASGAGRAADAVERYAAVRGAARLEPALSGQS